jgi:hypothetical protein
MVRPIRSFLPRLIPYSFPVEKNSVAFKMVKSTSNVVFLVNKSFEPLNIYSLSLLSPRVLFAGLLDDARINLTADTLLEHMNNSNSVLFHQALSLVEFVDLGLCLIIHYDVNIFFILLFFHHSSIHFFIHIQYNFHSFKLSSIHLI